MPAAAPSCPRCGYDQSGAVAAWERSEPACCPLDGVCSECGLEFWWRDLLNPVYARELRLFEHARSRRLISLLLTLWRAQRPRSLWRWVRMEQEIVWPRALLASLIGVILATALALAITVGCSTAFALVSVSSRTLWSRYIYSPDLWALDWVMDWRSGSLGPPFPMRVMPWSFVAILAATLMPLMFLLLPVTLRRAKVRRAHLVRMALYAAVGVPLALALPSLLLLVAANVCLADFGLHEGPGWSRGVPRWLHRHRWFFSPVALALWTWVWWSAAAAWYLRLPRGAVIGGVMVVLAFLMATALVAVVPGGLAWLMTDA